MNSIVKFIKFADIYGQRVQMNFSNQPIYKTVYGGLVTLIIGSCFLSGCYFFGCILFQRLHPSIITQERSVTSAARIDINNTNIVAMFGISNGASQIWSDPTIFRMYAVQQVLQIKNSTESNVQLRQLISYNKTMKKCDQSDIGIPEVNRYFSELNLTNLYCLDQGQDLHMEGDFDAQKFAQVFIYVEKCSNGTDPNIICKPMEVINKQLELSKIQIYLSNTIVDPLNYEDPFSSKGMNLYTQTSSSFPKEVQLYFTNQYIQDDIGFMFSQVEQKHKFVFTQQQETTFFSNYNVLVRVLLRLQKQKENLMQRRYQKFQDIVAQIGGLMKLLTTIGSFITYRFTSLYLYKAIGDEILIYDDENIQKSKKEKIGSSSICQTNKNKASRYRRDTSIKSVKQGKEPESIEMNKNQSAQFQIQEEKQKSNKNEKKKSKFEKVASFDQQNQSCIQQVEEKHSFKLNIIQPQKFFNLVKNKIKYNFIDYFKQIFANYLQKKDYRAQLVQKGIQIIEQQLDIVYLINKLNEIDKLKTVIFNRDQLKIFDCIPKPIISDDYLFNHKKEEDQIQNQNRGRADSMFASKMVVGKDNIVYYNIQNKKSEEKKIQDAIYGIQNILNSQQLTKIDKKLIQIIDPQMLANYSNQKQQDQILDLNRSDIHYQRQQDDTIFESNVFQKMNSSNHSPNISQYLKIKQLLNETLNNSFPQQDKLSRSRQDSKISQHSQFLNIQDLAKQSIIFGDDQSTNKSHNEIKMEERLNQQDQEMSERGCLNINVSQYNPYLQFQATTLQSVCQKNQNPPQNNQPQKVEK